MSGSSCDLLVYADAPNNKINPKKGYDKTKPTYLVILYYEKSVRPIGGISTNTSAAALVCRM